MIFVMIQLNRGRPIGKLTLLLLWFKVGSLSTSSEAKYGKIFAKYLEASSRTLPKPIHQLLKDPSNCFVISSDFCHWGQRFRYTQYDQESGDIYQYIEALDKQVIGEWWITGDIALVYLFNTQTQPMRPRVYVNGSLHRAWTLLRGLMLLGLPATWKGEAPFLKK